jgi:hypothetical protein
MKSVPDEVNIEELAARHYSDLIISRVHADPKEFFSFMAASKKE